jgi:hypothetical protein
MYELRGILKKVFRMEMFLGAAIVTLIFVSTIFYKTYSHFIATDPLPQIGYYVPTVEKAGVPHAYTVKTGLFVRNFSVFNLVKNEFEMDVVVWFQFKPYRVSAEIIDKFSFSMGTIKSKIKSETKMIGEEMFIKYAVRVAFQTNLDYRRFPFDNHYVSIVLTNKSVSPEEVRLVSKGTVFGYSDDLFTYDWNIVQSDVRYGVLSSQLDEGDNSKTVNAPAVVFTFSMGKAGIRKILVLFIPLFLVFFLCLFSLIVQDKPAPMAIGAIGSLLAFRFVIEKMSPNVGYFTIVDRMYTYIISWAFLVFLVGMYFTFQKYRIEKEGAKTKGLIFNNLDQIKIYKQFFYIVSLIVFGIAIYYFVS